MSTVTSFTSERILQIEDNTIVGAAVVGDDLILTKHDTTTINAGNVRGADGAPGLNGDPGPAGTPFTKWVEASVANYPTIDPTGVSDSTSALSTAAAAAVALNGTLVIPPGTYRVDTRVTITLNDNQGLYVIAHGATFVCGSSSTSQGRLFRIVNTAGTTRTVTSIVEAITTANEYGFNNIWRTTLTCSTTPTGIVAGDYVRVFADNAVEGADIDVRVGQTCSVVAVNGNDVVVSGVLRDNFSTNPRLARLSAAQFTWSGGNFTDSAAILAASVGCGELIETRLLIRPRLENMSFINVMGPAIRTRHSYAWRMDDIQFRWLHNQSSAAYGYGINDDGEFGIATRIHAERVRHAYTTASETWVNGAVEQFGRAYGTKIINGVGHGCMAATWDTHGDAEGIEFHGCTSVDGEGAYHFRGRKCRVFGGSVRGPHQGAVVTCDDASSGDISQAHYISGLVIEDVTGDIFVCSNATDGPATIPSYFVDCQILSRDTTKYIFKAVDSMIEHRGIGVAAGGTRALKTGTGSISLMTVAADTA